MSPVASRLGHATTLIPPFDGANGWLNSEPLSPDDLRGHVVLVNFWTFTCVNWLRTAPYVRAWAERYKEQGLVTVGVHTPEFDVEHDFGNVERMVRKLHVHYPVAIDNDYAVWNAFANRYWPAVYLADAEGGLRFEHFGEGAYEDTERAIQELLEVDRDLVSVEPSGLEVAANWDDVESPETYVGYRLGERFASPGEVVPDERRAYEAPATLARNQWALTGEWTIRQQPAVLHEAGGSITYRFHARDLNLVLAAGDGAGPVRFRVLLDGDAPGASRGSDVDEQGNGTLSEPRLYALIRQPGRITDRTCEVTFLDSGAQVYVFTFG
jgi:thiol-disulfide isomerase/thioredoxin